MHRILVLLVLAACDDALLGVPKDGGTETPTPPTVTGWCGVQQVFLSDCLACHSAASALGGLDLETDPYATLVNQPSIAYTGTLVVPSDPAGSLLYRKVSGTQTASEGGIMQPGTGLDPASVAVIEAWIADGASDLCDTPPTGTVTGVHPDGFAAGAVHGYDAKFQVLPCQTCHGADLTGETGPSCDTCHAERTTDWRTDCTFCHGGANGDTTGAPPENIDDSTDPVKFDPHQTHVTTDLRAELDCTECHQKPENVLSLGHLFEGDFTPGVAEVDFRGVSLGGNWDPTAGAGSCTVYCHGNGQTGGTVALDSGPKDCGDCHASMTSTNAEWDRMSGEHGKHLEDVGAACADCHPTTLDNVSIADPLLHLDGDPDVLVTGGTVVWDGNSCAGTCHTQNHNNCTWNDCP